MDTSEQYIKMCDCPEIQGKKAEGNEFSIRSKNPYIWIEHEGSFFYAKHDMMWLPRQDQIQEMFKGYDAFILAGKFNGEMENLITGNPSKWTMEQLWLAFYMWEKHKKIWDGEKWREK